MLDNVLVPKLYEVKSNEKESADVYTLTLAAKEGTDEMTFLPGQFNMLHHFGFGEVAISHAGDSSCRGQVVHTVRSAGPVTEQMSKLKPGDEVGVRGPFGSTWPLDKEGSDVLLIAGGIGLPPLRSALCALIANKSRYNSLTLLYGAKNPEDLIYREDLRRWQEQGVKVVISVDQGDANWKGPVGVITHLIQKNIRDPKNILALICGPEIMIEFSVKELEQAGVAAKDIAVSLERHMQCGVGFCGRCQYGPFFLCKDGPVLPYEKLQHWFWVKEL